jgi:hypothetical protein
MEHPLPGVAVDESGAQGYPVAADDVAGLSPFLPHGGVQIGSRVGELLGEIASALV